MALVMALFGASAQADNMSFRGTLLDAPPCSINGGKPVEIDFGAVGVNKVDGDNYRQTFTLEYECEGTNSDMQLRYLGNATDFDSAAVQTNIADFGIRLQHQRNGVVTPFKVGERCPSRPIKGRRILSPRRSKKREWL